MYDANLVVIHSLSSQAIVWEFCLKFSLANIGTALRFATHIYW